MNSTLVQRSSSDAEPARLQPHAVVLFHIHLASSTSLDGLVIASAYSAIKSDVTGCPGRLRSLSKRGSASKMPPMFILLCYTPTRVQKNEWIQITVWANWSWVPVPRWQWHRARRRRRRHRGCMHGWFRRVFVPCSSHAQGLDPQRLVSWWPAGRGSAADRCALRRGKLLAVAVAVAVAAAETASLRARTGAWALGGWRLALETRQRPPARAWGRNTRARPGRAPPIGWSDRWRRRQLVLTMVCRHSAVTVPSVCARQASCHPGDRPPEVAGPSSNSSPGLYCRFCSLAGECSVSTVACAGASCDLRAVWLRTGRRATTVVATKVLEGARSFDHRAQIMSDAEVTSF
jgi:hypothetical protein